MARLPRCRSSRSWFRSVLGGALVLASTTPVVAQTWEPPRSRPVLLEIGTVDATGEDGWLYGAEDVAGDGLDRFQPPERTIDFRSVYAAAGAERLWLRSYVSATSAPGDVRLFVFIDSDRNRATGGSADAPDLDERFDSDPTDGGYEYVVAVRGDGSVEGLWSWSEDDEVYEPLDAEDVLAEVGTDVDPLRVGPAQRGYVQLVVPLASVGLTEACTAHLFVRSVQEGSEELGPGDLDVGEPLECVPRAASGQEPPPVVVPPPGCSEDEQCPAGGLCVDGRCVLPPLCREDADCAEDETCDEGVCVFDSSTTTCSDDAACGDLVCTGGTCAACTSDASCGAGRRCAATGRCVDGGSAPGDGGGDGDLGELAEGEKIQGGAFTCHWAPGAASIGGWGALGLVLSGLGLGAGGVLRGRRRRTRAVEGEEP